uniref:Uncharacterized protein n=2 Tax=Anguilla anguilla TaxID=7936 RepID=A0A0E9PR42_ANGAN
MKTNIGYKIHSYATIRCLGMYLQYDNITLIQLANVADVVTEHLAYRCHS